MRQQGPNYPYPSRPTSANSAAASRKAKHAQARSAHVIRTPTSAPPLPPASHSQFKFTGLAHRRARRVARRTALPYRRAVLRCGSAILPLRPSLETACTARRDAVTRCAVPPLNPHGARGGRRRRAMLHSSTQQYRPAPFRRGPLSFSFSFRFLGASVRHALLRGPGRGSTARGPFSAAGCGPRAPRARPCAASARARGDCSPTRGLIYPNPIYRAVRRCFSARPREQKAGGCISVARPARGAGRSFADGGALSVVACSYAAADRASPAWC